MAQLRQLTDLPLIVDIGSGLLSPDSALPDEPSASEALRDGAEHTFHSLIADAESTLVVVVRFLALLEMYRDRVVRLHQDEVLGPLLVRWDGARDWSAEALSSEYTGAEPDQVTAAAPGGHEGAAPQAPVGTDDENLGD